MSQNSVMENLPQASQVGDLDVPMISPLGSLDNDMEIDTLQLDETPKTTSFIIYKAF